MQKRSSHLNTTGTTQMPEWQLDGEQGQSLDACLVHTRVRVMPFKEGRSLRLLYAVGAHAHPPPLILKLIYGQLSHQASQVSYTNSSSNRARL